MEQTSRRLILMRHAESPRAFSGSDFERNLSNRGEQQAIETGTFLNVQKWLPDIILVSTAKRASQTADLLTKSWEQSVKIIFQPELYNPTINKIEKSIREAQFLKEPQTLLILAHNPAISRFAELCCHPEEAFYFAPASIAAFNVSLSKWEDFSFLNTQFSFYKEPHI